MKEKVRKVVRMVMVVAIMTAMLLPVAVAADGGTTEFNLSGLMETSFQKVVSDVVSMITMALPIALGLLGMTVAISFGVKWFKKLVGKTG